jgi:hypothetical protein
MINNDYERDLGLEQWKRLLLNGRKDVFVAGGSDAHGDFSHATTVLGDFDNAFGKVRTCVYTETFGNDKILNALKNGHSIMTDGPLVVFNITNNHGETAIIGDEIAGRDFSLNLQWASTSEFGNVDHIYVHRGIIGENETEISGLSLAPDNLEGNITFNDLQSYIPSDNDSYIRINATTDKGYRVYTNPIFIKELPAKITVADAIIALEMAVRGEYSADADVNDDGYVTSLDALMILQAAAGSIEIG